MRCDTPSHRPSLVSPRPAFSFVSGTIVEAKIKIFGFVYRFACDSFLLAFTVNTASGIGRPVLDLATHLRP